ncbi:MAG: hypothetical protein U0132_01690 [Gemmatimonadaceae bacterium]
MSHRSVPPTHTERDTSSALNELLHAEREIAGELERVDEQAARILDDARAELARRREAALNRKVQALAQLEARLRAHAAADESNARARAAATCLLFDETSSEQIEQLADDMLAELYGLPAERAS